MILPTVRCSKVTTLVFWLVSKSYGTVRLRLSIAVDASPDLVIIARTRKLLYCMYRRLVLLSGLIGSGAAVASHLAAVAPDPWMVHG
jgi:hypothetical protein